MRVASKFLGLAVAVMFSASAARADVFVFGLFDKVYTKTVVEEILIFKDVFVEVDVLALPDSAAESEVVKNQRNEFNVVEEFEVDSAAIIDGSGIGANGILLINQSPGHVNNQGNEVSVAYADSIFGFGTFAHSTAAVAQINQANVRFEEFGIFTTSIVGSFNDGFGIVGVNQAAGSLNNQDNAASAAIGNPAIVSLSEADLGQFNQLNMVDAIQSVRTDSISGSFNGHNGIAMANQASGSLNNQANVVSIAVSTGIGLQ